jgi:hypothetical protein
VTEYIKFKTSAGDVLIEADVQPADLEDDEGPSKAGFRDWIRGSNVVEAKTTLEEALERTLAANAQALGTSAGKLKPRPDVIELTFGLKATGELGNIAIAKVSAEASMNVRILWQRSGDHASD